MQQNLILHRKGLGFFFYTFSPTDCPTSPAVVVISAAMIIISVNAEPFPSRAVHKYAPVNLSVQMKPLMCRNDGAGVQITRVFVSQMCGCV